MLTRARGSYWRDESTKGQMWGQGDSLLALPKDADQMRRACGRNEVGRKDDLGKSVVLVVAGTSHLQDGTCVQR